MEETVSMKLWFKIVLIIGGLAFIAVIVYACLNDGDIYERVTVVILGVLFSGLGLGYGIYCCVYKIYVGSDYIRVRKPFKTKNYKLSEVTKIDYKLMAFGNYEYVLYFGKDKVSVSPVMNNKITLDRKLDEAGIFKKYPRINY